MVDKNKRTGDRKNNSSKSIVLSDFGYKQELRQVLSLSDLVTYGLVFMVVIAPFGIYGVVAEMSKGMVALVYLIAMGGMLFTAFSYWRMAEVFPISGSVYAYTSRAINKNVGFLSGWLIILDYLLTPALLYVVSADALTSIIPNVPTHIWIILFIGVNTIINILGIEFSAKVNKVIIVIEIIIFLIFVGASIKTLATNGVSDFTWKPFYDPENFSLKAILPAVSIAVLSFMGFDAISTLAEETKDGASEIGKGCVLALIIAGVLFIIQTFFAALIWPDYTSFSETDAAFYEVAFAAGGPKVMWICAVATAFGWGIANSLVAQIGISRIIFSMARDGFLPPILSKVHHKYQTPYVAIALIALISIIITMMFSDSISVLSMLINFGALTSFMILNLTVIYYFIFKKKSKRFMVHLVMPLIGFLINTFIWYNLHTNAKLLGCAWFVLGVVLLWFKIKLQKKEVDLEI